MSRLRTFLAPLPRLVCAAILSIAALVPCACRDEATKGTRTSRAAEDVPIDTSGPIGTGGFTITNPTASRPYFHDFKRVLYGEKLRHMFVLRNDDGRALTVNDMIASCGCTSGRLSFTDADGEHVLTARALKPTPLVVPAGATVELEITIDTTQVEHVNVDKLSQLRLRCDSPTNPYLTFEMHLLVARPFRSVPAKIEFGEVPQSTGKVARTDISTEMKGDLSRIDRILSVEGTFTAELQATQIAGERVWILSVTAPPGLPLGPVTGSVTMSTFQPDGTAGGVFEVPILAQVTTDVVAHPGVLQMPNLPSGAGGEVQAEILALVPAARPRVVSVEVKGDDVAHITAETRPNRDDDGGRAALHALFLRIDKARASGPFHGTIVITFDPPDTPPLSVPFSGSVL